MDKKYISPAQMMVIANAIKKSTGATGAGGENTEQAINSLYAGVLTNPETGEPFFISDLIECAGNYIESYTFNKEGQPEYENITDLQNKVKILTDTVFDLCKKPGNRLCPVIVTIPFIEAGFSMPDYDGYYNEVKESEDFEFANNNTLWMIIPHSLGRISMITISPHFVINPYITLEIAPEWDYYEEQKSEERGITGVDETLSLSYIHLIRTNETGMKQGNEKIYRRQHRISNIFTKPLINNFGIFPYDRSTSSFWPEFEGVDRDNISKEEIKYTYDSVNNLHTKCAELYSEIENIKKQIGME